MLKPHRRIAQILPLIVGLSLSVAACRDPGGIEAPRTTAAAFAGDEQFGAQNGFVADPLQVIVTDAVTHEPRNNIAVQWEIVDGTGTVTPVSARTNTRGIVSATLQLGPNLGTVHVRAKPDGLVGNPAVFAATAIVPPVITGISPASARAGDTITITGSSFGTTAAAVSVLFDGVRGLVVSHAVDRVRAVVPSCVATRNAVVRVAVGAVM
jgi:hypothetical protein